MTQAPTQPEVIDAPGKELARIVQESGLAESKADAVKAALVPLAIEAYDLIALSGSITVTALDQVTEMEKARRARIDLGKIRVRVDKTRAALKADALATGKAIESLAKWLIGKIEPEEARLLACEDFARNAEAAHKAALRAAREEALKPYAIDTSAYQLGEMSEQAFAQLLDGTRLAHESKVAKAKADEEARVAAEATRVAEELRVREENDRLRKASEDAAARRAAEIKEAEDRLLAVENKARAEREAAEAKARAAKQAADLAASKERLRFQALADVERQKREALEREAKAKAAAEAKAAADAEKARKKAERAPDVTKIRAFADAILAVPLPTVKSEEAEAVLKRIVDLRGKFVAFIRQQAETMGGAS